MRSAFVLIASLLVHTGIAFAHGDHAVPPPAIKAGGPLSRGASEAFACDIAIHEVLFEYDNCLNARRSAVAQDGPARVGFWLVATLRAQGARDNGYADADDYLLRYRAALAAAQAALPRPIAAPCSQLGLACPATLTR
ncbi:hypothetical protein GCM10025771_07260 [Niveibacterium umoris]|uniref:Rap1a immunity protein domain-containing protein n=1 Tax=Niveibacterium umoris TaxID=1193620 RepID=A0A840BTP5_9RHOO|nr:hypothetical protein [Niveibacterium umoris]MBB4013727.1 hypothetical protein [Niveibacterium umoris]